MTRPPTSFEVILAPDARVFFERADSPLQRRMDRCFEVLSLTPDRHNNITPLKGPLRAYHRFRLAEYRLIYRIDHERRTVYVLKIAHRREVYE